MGHLAKNTVLSLVSNPVAAASTAVQSSWVDAANFEGVRFMGTIGATTGTATVTVNVNSSTTGAGSALSGASVSVGAADDNKGFCVDVYSPHSKGRYLRGVLTPTTGTFDFSGFLAETYGGRKHPKSSTALIDGAVDLVVVQTT